MPKSLVSGGTGYVGRFIVDALIARGHEVTVLSRREPRADLFIAPVHFMTGELDPGRDQSHAFQGMDLFVHAAFDHLPGLYRGGEGDDPASFRMRNVDGSKALFDAARKAGVGRAVFLSSRAVYGTQPPGARLSEETRPHPDTLYGEAKHAVERHLREIGSTEAFAGTSLRVTGVYGPAGRGKPDDKWTPIIRDWLDGRAVESRAGSEVHGSDVAGAVLAILDAPASAVAGQVFNVSDVMVDRTDILAIVQQATGHSAPLPQPADSSRINVMETDRIEALGWRPGGVKRLRDTVLDLVDKLEPARSR
jgi:nucleoside-diphosphate-sugar epimerase